MSLISELSKVDLRNCATTLVGVFEFGIVAYLPNLPRAMLVDIIGQAIVNSPAFHPDAHLSVKRGTSRLQVKKVGKNLWSARVSGGFRALALKKGDDYYWIWIGTHDEYESFL